MERDSVLFYRSFYEAIESIENLEERAAVYGAVLAYAMDGIEPELSGYMKAVFLLIKPQIDANNAKYENAKKGGRKPKANQTETESEPNSNQTETKTEPNGNQTETKTKPNQNQTETKTEPNPNLMLNVRMLNEGMVNENENVNVNEEHKGRTSAPRFRKPTREEVAEYCQERGNHVNVDRFMDYYESNGWKVGKNPMKDWKAAVRTWEKNGYDNPRGKPNTYGGSTERANAFDDLEEQLLNELNGGL